ncbi:TPM domain-containing protein [Qipengyuania aquimaris]|uniref:TPM domain-containing protein n=1 Tax=Qipengyuania aquimaris TaxID=255984 RepID=UPI001FD1AD37|nr:TPM domain-containing protein [Qipengyuania aquimaris]UOR14345.1 TPM domain-containing protein [Qipengyuania aquimaris]
MIARILLLLAIILGFASPAAAQPEFPELNNSPVVDQANLLDPAQEDALEQKLLEFEQRNQRQFVVATLDNLQGYDIADYGYQLGRHWGIGDEDRNDGILLIIAPNERQMRVEVGYGLEGIIPDGLAFEYVEGMKPYFRNGDFSGGINWGADEIIKQLELPPEEAAQIAQNAERTTERRESSGGFPLGGLIWFAFVFFFFILPILRGSGRRRRRYRRGPWGNTARDIILWEAGKAIARGLDDRGGGWGGGGGFGGGFGGGGGFSGGGGSFGGGGASGGW